MGRVLAVEYLTLDGVFEEPLWTQPYFDEEVGAFQGAAMSWADALLLGRVTYEGMSVAWPAMGSEPGTGGDIMNPIGKYVPTSTLTEPTWNATFLPGDAIASVAEIKSGDEDLLIYGSGRLTESLRAAGLIDEYRLIIAPIVLGSGRRLFVDGAPSEFRVVENRTAASGMLLVTLAAV